MHHSPPRSLLTLAALVVASALGTAGSAAAQIVAGQIDDFQDGTNQGWTVGAGIDPIAVADAGPDGTGDFALRAQSSGAPSGANSRLAMFGDATWDGDYTAAGITALRLDLNNAGANEISLRAVIRSFTTGEAWVSDPVIVQGFSGWFVAEISLLADDLVPASDNSSNAVDPDGTLASVSSLKLLHATGPTERAFNDPILADLFLDNIEAVPEPASATTALGALATLAWLRRRTRI